MSYLDYITNDFARGWVANRAALRDGVHVPLVYIDINEGHLQDAIMFAQIMYWHEPNKETGEPRMKKQIDGHLWLAKNHGDWYDECRIVASSARKCLARLKERGLIHYELHGFAGNATPHIRVNWEVFSERVQGILTPVLTGHPPVPVGQTPCPDGSGPLSQQVKPNTETTTETTTESLLGDRNTPAVIAIHQPTTPTARTPRPHSAVQNQPVDESTQKADVRSDLEEVIQATFKTYPGGANRKRLNRVLKTGKDTEVVEQPTPIERYDTDPEYRAYCHQQIEYWYNRAEGEGQPPRSFLKRLTERLFFVEDDKYGYFKWLHNKGKPLPDADDDGPVEWVQF